MASSRFSPIFDELDTDKDISMVNLELDDPRELSKQLHSPHSPPDSELTRRQTLPAYDIESTKSLLRGSSFATTSDYESVKNVYNGMGEAPRQRLGAGIPDGIKRVWRQKTGLTQRPDSTFDGKFAHGEPGWWNKQMLVDRSLRSMAGFTAICALIMWTIVFFYLGPFLKRLNKHSTSVGRDNGESCSEAESKDLASHLFINVAATMILGCSNTYQQLITSLKVDEIRWVLSKRGDSKVGTNSPWSINHKKSGRRLAWLGWTLLISTSMPGLCYYNPPSFQPGSIGWHCPRLHFFLNSRITKTSAKYSADWGLVVHFLANSIIGPSFYIKMPSKIIYQKLNATQSETLFDGYSSGDYSDSPDTACWTAFRANSYQLPSQFSQLSSQYNPDNLGNSTTFDSVLVQYTSNCTEYLNNTSYAESLAETYTTSTLNTFSIGSCQLGQGVYCVLGDPQTKQCRVNVRMQAALILGGCLIIKAMYMITLNVRARHRVKTHCLTYGDVIVASVLDPDLKIRNECLLNSGDGYRNAINHTCHKHCRNKIPSASGDSIGHCQKCKNFNIINKAADLPHPSIAIKFKRSLLSNLGSTAITQMTILTFTSVALIGVSILLIVNMVYASIDYKQTCLQQGICPGLAKTLAAAFGTWGGFGSSATLASLPPDSLGSEFMSFVISNGAQFLYSLLYLLLIYNLTLVSMEHEWGDWERKRRRPRCTIVTGQAFEQSYFLQLPSKILLPMMTFAALMHWLLGQAISTIETIYTDPVHHVEHSIYFVTYAAYPIFLSTVCMIVMTAICWWAFTYTREGFIPQMYGSIRTCCASTTELMSLGREGILWGDLGMGEKFRHAGFSNEDPDEIVPAELYCGRD